MLERWKLYNWDSHCSSTIEDNYPSNVICGYLEVSIAMGVWHNSWRVYFKDNPIVRKGWWLGVALWPWKPPDHDIYCQYSEYKTYQIDGNDDCPLWLINAGPHEITGPHPRRWAQVGCPPFHRAGLRSGHGPGPGRDMGTGRGTTHKGK